MAWWIGIASTAGTLALFAAIGRLPSRPAGEITLGELLMVVALPPPVTGTLSLAAAGVPMLVGWLRPDRVTDPRSQPPVQA